MQNEEDSSKKEYVPDSPLADSVATEGEDSAAARAEAVKNTAEAAENENANSAKRDYGWGGGGYGGGGHGGGYGGGGHGGWGGHEGHGYGGHEHGGHGHHEHGHDHHDHGLVQFIFLCSFVI